MKKAAFISGALFGSLFGLGTLFKIMHWPGAGILLVVGIGLFSFVFVPSLATFLYKRNVN
jgi:hypothetical protein